MNSISPTESQSNQTTLSSQADIGLIGLAVMGENLVLNMESHGFKVAVYNRTTSKVDEFLTGRAHGKNIVGTHTLSALVASLKRPRKIMLMVKAGVVVDQFIEQILPYLQEGDIIIDGGNSLHTDSTRRTRELREKGILYIGTGVSGGEEGALKGPSIMPGGAPEAWDAVKPIFQSIAAKVEAGSPCCDWVGPEGAGHFVKMVHNGIEYGDMQLICEIYHVLKATLNPGNDKLAHLFDEWNQGELNSYLVEITADILKKKDENGNYVLDYILDKAGQKGTGKWTVNGALDLGVPVTLIAEAVFARCLSAQKQQRVNASKVIQFNTDSNLNLVESPETFAEAVRGALYCAKVISYAQGFELMKATAKEMSWDLNMGSIALMWRGGCIIRSTFLGKIKEAYDRNPALENLLLDPFFAEVLHKYQAGWRKVIAVGALQGIALPALSSALSYFDGYRSSWLPANLLQAQRDYFGAHTYERTDKAAGAFFHTNWTGRGGNTTSNTYSV